MQHIRNPMLCLSDPTSPMAKHCDTYKHDLRKVKFQILSKAPNHEPNKELWLEQNEFHWICRLGTLNKLISKKGLNKTVYDPTFHSSLPH